MQISKYASIHAKPSVPNNPHWKKNWLHWPYLRFYATKNIKRALRDTRADPYSVLSECRPLNGPFMDSEMDLILF